MELNTCNQNKVPFPVRLILADDDIDDCLLFNEALNSVAPSVKLSIVNNGEQLMQLLYNSEGDLPEALFLDLNMPRKNGYECLPLIKKNDKLSKLKVIVHSTSCDPARLDLFYAQGALCYVQKPAEFSNLKAAILKTLTLITDNFIVPRDKFLINL